MKSLPERLAPYTVEAVPVDNGPRIGSAFLAELAGREALRAQLAATLQAGS